MSSPLLYCFLLSLILPLESLRIQSTPNGVWVNGKKVAGPGSHSVYVRNGGVYVDGRRIPNLKVNDGGGGGSYSMSASSWLTVDEELVDGCGNKRKRTPEDQHQIDEFNAKVKEYWKKRFPPGFPAVPADMNAKYPQFPKLC